MRQISIVFACLALLGSIQLLALDDDLENPGKLTVRGTITDLKRPEQNIAFLRDTETKQSYVVKNGMELNYSGKKYKVAKIASKEVILFDGENYIELYAESPQTTDTDTDSEIDASDDEAELQLEEIDNALLDLN